MRDNLTGTVLQVQYDKFTPAAPLRAVESEDAFCMSVAARLIDFSS